MAKGADCDKLAAEFAEELDNLGVRVAKLEKGADAVKITGQFRADYKTHDNGDADTSSLRSRLWVNGAINDDWSYTGMFQSTQKLNDNVGNDSVELKRVYVEGKVGGLQVLAGRWNEFFWNANVLDNFVDGVRVTYGDDVKLGFMIGEMTNDGAYQCEGDFLAANVSSKIGAVDASFNYFKVNDAYVSVNTSAQGTTAAAVNNLEKKEIYNVNLGFDVAKDVRLSYEYMWGDKKYNKNVSKDGFVARLDYKGADIAAPGSYGIHAQWFDQPINAILTPTTDATVFEDGYEGWNVGVDYTLAKNIQLCVNWYDTEAIKGAEKDEVLYSELYFFF